MNLKYLTLSWAHIKYEINNDHDWCDNINARVKCDGQDLGFGSMQASLTSLPLVPGLGQRTHLNLPDLTPSSF